MKPWVNFKRKRMAQLCMNFESSPCASFASQHVSDVPVHILMLNVSVTTSILCSQCMYSIFDTQVKWLLGRPFSYLATLNRIEYLLFVVFVLTTHIVKEAEQQHNCH